MSIIIILIFLMILGYLIITRYLNNPIQISLTEKAKIQTSIELPGTLWTSLYKSCEKDYNIKIPEYDESKYTIIVSCGREIKELTYTKKSKYETSIKGKPFVGKVIFKNKLYPHTVFVYQTEKINIINQEEAGSFYEIKIED